MTFVEYFKKTKYTTKNCLKITGVIFTVIATIIAGITGVMNHAESIVDVAKIFAICVLFGNVFGVFIFLLAITSAYKQIKSTVKLYNFVPDEIKKKYGFNIFVEPTNLKYNYPKTEIMSNENDMPFLIIRRITNNDIQIIGVSAFDNEFFQMKALDIDNRYRKNYIFLTGMGISKRINRKTWEKSTSTDIEGYIQEIIIISEKEGIPLEIVAVP